MGKCSKQSIVLWARGTHTGVTKTLRRLRLGFYWGQHKRDVEDFCHRCDGCTARKGPTKRSHAQLQQCPVGFPMERVGVDGYGDTVTRLLTINA